MLLLLFCVVVLLCSKIYTYIHIHTYIYIIKVVHTCRFFLVSLFYPIAHTQYGKKSIDHKWLLIQKKHKLYIYLQQQTQKKRETHEFFFFRLYIITLFLIKNVLFSHKCVDPCAPRSKGNWDCIIYAQCFPSIFFRNIKCVMKESVIRNCPCFRVDRIRNEKSFCSRVSARCCLEPVDSLNTWFLP